MARFQLAHDLDERLLAGLLQGILKRSILLDSTITEAVLVESVFAASRATAPEQKALIAGFTDFVVAAAHHDWSPERLASELRARSIASPETVAVCEAFWRSTQLKARAALAQRSFWSPTALDVAWRVEIEAGSSAPRPARPSTDASGGDASGAPAAEPHAVIELTTGARRLPASSTATPTSEGSSTIAAGSSQLRFRADRESLLGLVESLRAAEAAASRLSE